jgi:calcineurin-like phosphoesterase family protein
MLLPQPQFPFDDQTWIISDTHFFHENIGRYCDRPDGWQETIIENWNRLIQPEEIVFHVGDLALGKKENIEGLAPLLNGRLYLMRGNHDRRSNGFYQ